MAIVCGRYSAIFTVDEFSRYYVYGVHGVEQSARYNVAPSTEILIVKNDGREMYSFARWGLRRAWSSEKSGITPINAKSETLAESRLFAPLLRRKRCIVAASGFYEWQHIGGKKQPWYFQVDGGRPFAFAGLWDAAGEETTCLIITGQPNALVAPVHNRMPIILDPAQAGAWIRADEQSAETLLPMLQTYPAARMSAYKVSPKINRVQYNASDAIVPIGDALEENDTRLSLFGDAFPSADP